MARIKLIKYLLSLSRQKFKHSSISLKWSTCRTQFVNPSQGTDHHRHTKFYHHASQASPRNILGSGSPYSRWNGGEERADRELSKPWHCVIMALDIHHHSSPQTLPLVSEVRDEKDIKVATYTSHLCIDYEIYEVMMETYKWEKPFSCARVKLFSRISHNANIKTKFHCNRFMQMTRIL